MSTIDLSSEAQAEDACSNQAALWQRTRERSRSLLASDPELARTLPSAEAMAAVRGCPTTIELVAKAFELYGDRPCLRERAFEIAAEGADAGSVRLLPDLRTIGFADLWARTGALASGLVHAGLTGPGSFVGICGFGGVDWVVADLACLYLAAVSVPLQTGMSTADLQQIITEAELSCIVSSVEQLDALGAVLPQCPSVRSVVVMDLREGDRRADEALGRYESANRGRVSVFRMTDLEARGREQGIVPKVLPSARSEDDPLMSLVYTSGSTGTPKGAMIPESLFIGNGHPTRGCRWRSQPFRRSRSGTCR